MGGLAEFLAGKNIVCLSLPTDLCLAQGAFSDRRRSSTQISVWPKGQSSTDAESLEFFFPYSFLRSALLEDTPPPPIHPQAL